MKQDAPLPGDGPQRGDIVDHTDLVVHVHQRHQNGVLAQRRLQLFGTDQPIGTGLEPGHLEAFALQLATGIDDRLVFDLRGNDVPTTLGHGPGRALDRQVVGLSGTGGPDNLPGVGADQIGDLTPGQLHRFLGLPAVLVRARGRVGKNAIHGQAATHLLRHPRVNRCGGGIVEIDR